MTRGEEGEVEVRVMSECMVRPATPTPPGRHLYLSGVDMLWWKWPINRLFFYSLHPWGRDQYARFVDSLCRSLRHTLVHFYPCAGRLGPDPTDPARLSILCNDAGIEFVQASVDISFADLQMDRFRPRKLFHSLSPFNGIPAAREPDKSLISVQVTHFTRDGVALGITAKHVISDGLSFWHFMNSWSECARGLPISRLPLHNRKLLSFTESTMKSFYERSLEQSVDRSKLEDGEAREANGEHKEDQEKHGNDEGNGNARKELCEQHLFHVSKKQLAYLKVVASEGEANPTSFEALCAHFWRHVTKARDLSHEQESAIALGLDIRSLVKPPLPPNYYGNAVISPIAIAKAGELYSESVGATASRIHNTLSKSKNDATIRNALKSIEQQGPEIPLSGHLYVVDSPKFPMYEVDFGWGKPESVRISHMYTDGEMVCLAGARGDGSIDVCLSLPPQHMERLLLDQQFLSLSPTSRY